MYEVLHRFNFGNNFIKWVKILYEKPVISIKNNGWNSGDIDLERGVRQGCPLSALIFVLSVEVMAINIRNNTNINGFICGDREIKNSLYADDTTLLLRNLESLDIAIDTVNKFSAVAGPKLNKDKTEGILLGTLKNTVLEYSGIKFTNNAVRALGVYIGHDRQKCYEKNWTNKIDKIKIIFERWKNRNLTLFGKILIIKSLASSILIHTMSIIVTPEEVLKEIEKLIFNFLWNSTDRIKRKTLIGSKGDGGIKMLDIFCKDKALKAGWFRRLHTKNVNSDYINMLLQRQGLSIDYLIKTNCTNQKLLSDRLKIPKFWAQVFASLNECKDLRPFSSTSDYNFLSAPLWFNEQFKFKNKPIFLPNWAKSNILYVKDLFSNQGLLVSENFIFGTLTNKQNWISEYSMVKKVLTEILDDFTFDTTNARYINIRPNWSILAQNSYYYIKTQKSSFYYNILVKNKFIKNYMEDVWELNLDINMPNWKDIYNRKIWGIHDKKLAEFNYKVLCNILCTRSRVFKWNKDLDDKCPYCNEVQNVKHLFFECRRVNSWGDN